MLVDDESAIPRLRQALARGGIEVQRMEQVTPSLEDVFVSLIEEADRQEEGLG